MIKKVLIPTITAAIGITAFSGVYMSNKDNAKYKERTVNTADAEPYSMAWAKIDLDKGEFNPARIIETKKQLLNKAQRGDLGLTFVNLGPDNIGGRTRAILELYGEPNTLLAGGVTGGLFVSYNAGGTWEPHPQFQNLLESSSIISCIHQDTITGNIYVGTGNSFDDNFLAFPGYGIYVSTDDGETFTHLSATKPQDKTSNTSSGWASVNRIATDAAGTIYAATGSGLQISTDDGATWTNPLSPNIATFSDVIVNGNGTVLASASNGPIYISKGGATGVWTQLNSNGLPLTGISRVNLSASPQNPNIMYALYTNAADACFHSVYKTTDGGDNWNKLLEKYGEFDPMTNSEYCQGVYDATIHVSHVDPNTIYIGGVQIWRYDGNLTRIASEGGAPPVQDILPNYVHADKHYITTSPNNPNRFYVTSDGGISMSTNKGETWQGINKGYVTTQFYDLAVANDGNVVLGGTQDNGTPVILGENPNDMKAAFSVSGGDGFDAAISQYSGFFFSTSQVGVIYRGERDLPSAIVSGGSESGTSDFYTSIELWENTNDLTSKDSILFTVEPFLQSIATGNGIIRNYNETVYPVQPEAIVDESSLVVKSGGQELTVDVDGETLVGDGTGTVSFNQDGSFTITVTFDEAPSENANVDVQYEVRFEANAVLYVESQNLRSNEEILMIEHRLESALNSGDQIKIQDPAQSMLASDDHGSLHIYRNVLNAADNLQNTGIEFASINGGSIQDLKFSKDGNHLFVARRNSGNISRLDNLQELYTEEDIDKVSSVTFNTLSSTGIGGIALDPNDPNRMIVTKIGFGGGVKVAITENALSATPTFTDITGNLPEIPVYDATFNVNDPNYVLLATEFGVYASADITEAGGPTWSNESDETGMVPTYAIEQQQLPWEEAKNSGRVFVATFGRGFWVSTDLVGVNEIEHTDLSIDAISSLKVYPNPLSNQGRVEFEAATAGNIDLAIYDMNGRQIKAWSKLVSAGTNNITFEAGELKSGNYFMTIGSGESLKTAKFMVMK